MSIEKKNGGYNSNKSSGNVDKFRKTEKSSKDDKYIRSKSEAKQGENVKKIDKDYSSDKKRGNTSLQNDKGGQPDKNNRYKDKSYSAKSYEEKGAKNNGFKNKDFKATGSKVTDYNGKDSKENKSKENGSKDRGFFQEKGSQDREYRGKGFKDNGSQDKEHQGKGFKEKGSKDKEHQGKGIQEKGFKDRGYQGKGFKENESKEKGIRERNFKEKDYSSTDNRGKREPYQGKKQDELQSNKFHGQKAGNDKFTKEFRPSSKNAKCPVMYKCGGCQLLHLDYAKQLKEKQKKVEELLSQYGKVEPIIGMDNPDHYRNKVHAVFDHDRRGHATSGVYEAGTHNVIPVDSCLIENEKADEIIVSIRGLLKSFKIKTYDEDTEYGLLRHVLIRTGHKSGQIMVVLVLASPILPSKNNFVKALRQLHPEITTIIVNVNNKNTSMILGDKEQVIYGKGYIEDTLCEKVFHISPKSFYQVNPVQTEVLYKKAIDLAGLTGKETIIDAYCGIGTIGIIASDLANKVIGVELNVDAVKDANNNAKKNLITNIDFYNKDAGEFMSQMAAQEQKAEVVFMDPPRAGSDEKFLTSLCTLAPEKVVYISCNPVTLARDLEFLVKKGYKAKRIIPVDMFPHTSHVESIILLQKKNS
jgi:23S rRNA (uracil1939-C5)-methyltransferase